MKIKEVLKKVIPPSANTFHSFVAESNAANDRKMYTLVSEINKAGRTNQEILEKINRINETGQEIIEKMNNKENEHPKLAICVYHKREDAVDIAEYILSLNPDYKLYLRHEEHYMYCGTVLYAVP